MIVVNIANTFIATELKGSIKNVNVIFFFDPQVPALLPRRRPLCPAGGSSGRVFPSANCGMLSTTHTHAQISTLVNSMSAHGTWPSKMSVGLDFKSRAFSGPSEVYPLRVVQKSSLRFTSEQEQVHKHK